MALYPSCITQLGYRACTAEREKLIIICKWPHVDSADHRACVLLLLLRARDELTVIPRKHMYL